MTDRQLTQVPSTQPTQGYVPIRKKRQNCIEKTIDVSKAKVLEIGAFDYPTYTKERIDISFMDWFAPEEHFAAHATAPERAKNAIAVDYVIKNKNFSHQISKKFDLVIANHVVEHIADLIRWLQNISSVLNPNGYLFLAVPHKEYTFDKIRQLTSLAEILRSYEEDLQSPTLFQVFDHLYYYRPIRANQIWDGDFQDLLKQKRFANAKAAMEKARTEIAKNGYVDIHCNVFNHQSFLELCDELYASQYIDLKLHNSQDIEPPDNEFYVILQKTHS
jgi:SAM-dependent methyltransferase